MVRYNFKHDDYIRNNIYVTPTGHVVQNDKYVKPTYGGYVFKKRGYERCYAIVHIYIDGKRITMNLSRLVFSFYFDLKDGYVVDHIDNNQNNNCIWNLQQLTIKENNRKRNEDRKANRIRVRNNVKISKGED